jgi:hypothetical protein
MDEIISKKGKHRTHVKTQNGKSLDPFEELDRYFEEDLVRHEECRDVVAYWGVSSFEYSNTSEG